MIIFTGLGIALVIVLLAWLIKELWPWHYDDGYSCGYSDSYFEAPKYYCLYCRIFKNRGRKKNR